MEKERTGECFNRRNYKDAGQVAHSTIDILVSYECPECGWQHYLSPMQYLYKGYTVVCDCGTTFKPKNPKIGYENNNVFKYNNSLETIINILCTQGFSAETIKQASSKLTLTGNIDEDITKILQNL